MVCVRVVPLEPNLVAPLETKVAALKDGSMELTLAVPRERPRDVPKVDLKVVMRADPKALWSGFRLVDQSVDLTGQQRVVERVVERVFERVERLVVYSVVS